MGNAHLRWAFAEAACLFLRGSERARQWKQKQQKRHGSGKALAILAARLARAVWHMLRKAQAFDEDRFWGGRAKPAPAPGAAAEGGASRKRRPARAAADWPWNAPLRVPLLCSARRGAMPAIDYRRARQQVRLAAVLALIDYRPRSRRGPQWRGPCPLHGSRTPGSRSFAAHLGKDVFYCFGCGAGGNALDPWAALRRLPLHAAVLDLCRHLGQPVPWLGGAGPGRHG